MQRVLPIFFLKSEGHPLLKAKGKIGLINSVPDGPGGSAVILCYRCFFLSFYSNLFSFRIQTRIGTEVSDARVSVIFCVMQAFVWVYVWVWCHGDFFPVWEITT